MTFMTSGGAGSDDDDDMEDIVVPGTGNEGAGVSVELILEEEKRKEADELAAQREQEALEEEVAKNKESADRTEEADKGMKEEAGHAADNMDDVVSGAVGADQASGLGSNPEVQNVISKLFQATQGKEGVAVAVSKADKGPTKAGIHGEMAKIEGEGKDNKKEGDGESR